MDLRRINSYVEVLKPLLRLSDWKITVSESEPSDASDSIAETYIISQRPIANIKLMPVFFTGSREEKRHAMTHEMLHIHVHRLFHRFDDVEEHLNPPVFHVWKRNANEAMERTVDELSYIIAPHLPLPNF